MQWALKATTLEQVTMFIVAGCAWQVDTSGRRDSKPKASRVTNPSSSNVIVHLVSPKPWMVLRSIGLCQVNGTNGNQEVTGLSSIVIWFLFGYLYQGRDWERKGFKAKSKQGH